MERLSGIIPYDTWIADLDACEDSETRRFIIDTLKDKRHLHIFGRYFFPHIIQGTDDVPECHLDLIQELSNPKDSAIVFPRGFAKSTWEKIDTIHDFVYRHEELILYIGETGTDAGFHFEAIKGEIESNTLLQEVYGSLVPPETAKGRKWTNKHIETTNGVIALARGRNKGRGVNIKNKRPTKIIIDDAETDQLVRNQEQRTKYHRWLYDVIFPSANPKRGKIKVIGTAIHPLAEVVEFYKKHGGIYRRAIENGNSIWSGYFPLADLHAIRDGGVLSSGKSVKGIGTRAFNREYMNNPTASEEAKIKPEWIEAAHFSELPPEFAYEAIIYLDPQAGEKQTADEYALTVLYKAKQSVQRFVYAQTAGRITQFDQAKEVVRAWIKHKKIVRAVGIEKVLNQTAVYQTLIDWKAKRLSFNTPETPPSERIDEGDRNIPVIACSPKGKDKLARLEMFEPDFERGEIHLRPEQEELRYQLEHPTEAEHDDRMDSLVGALELAGRAVSTRERDALPTEQKKGYNRTIAGNLMKRTF